MLSKRIKVNDFKLLVDISGRFPFDRKTLGEELEKILIGKLRANPNNGSKNEFWFFLRGRLGLFGFKITDEKVKYRTYKVRNIPGSLKPQIVYAMCLVSEPDKEDVFIDPMCGVGTILIERALHFPFKLILGGDIDKEVVRLAKENIETAEVKARAQHWDAIQMKTVRTSSVDKVITNPPWGRTFGIEYNSFYPKLLRGFLSSVKGRWDFSLAYIRESTL